MMIRILYMFLDTNVFIQCRPLGELDWSEWESFTEIHLIVCRSVQREIDRQKYRGNDRVGNRARKTYSWFGKILDGEEGYELIRQDRPTVKLYLDPLSKPCQELSDRLNYSNPDDEIIGYLYTYAKQHPEDEVRLLTNDIGQIMTARSLGLQFIRVKSEWLLQPENSDEAREIARLKGKVDELQKTEPRFEIKCIDSENVAVSSLKLKYYVYEPMTEDDILDSLRLLKKRFPPAVDFGPREPPERKSSLSQFHIVGMMERYVPASDEAIAKYKDQEYPTWIKRCERVLSNLHQALQRKARLSFRFVAENKGTRPGKNVLVAIASKGNFKILPPCDDEGVSREEEGAILPLPPKPPHGQWKNIFSPFSGISKPDALSPLLLKKENRRDQNAFYYTPNRPRKPIKLFRLECELWRHETDAKGFYGEIVVDRNHNEINGVLECVIHAENLSSPVKQVVEVRVTVDKINARDCVCSLVNALCNSAST